jgi:hypothetical protein
MNPDDPTFVKASLRKDIPLDKFSTPRKPSALFVWVIILGCSQPLWGNFTELSTITREARNNRLTGIMLLGHTRGAVPN